MTSPLTTGAACTACGRPVAADARFCQFCGTPVEVASPEIRKVVTLLFCDVTGSTALGEQLDPEVLRGVMSRYFAVAKACVERHGGVVEKFVGDAVLAVFGVPEAREDDALRAVRAAGELRGGLAALSEELLATTGARLQVRTGVNTGSVIVGAGRAGGSFATGDAVNIAARLEQAAPPGEILIGEVTYSLVRDAVVVEAMAPLTLKGKAAPVTAYRLLDVLDTERGRNRPVAEILVGRESPQRVLVEAFARVIDRDRLELVTVIGSAGMGKTTLVESFLAQLRGQALVLAGRCPSYGHGITFWPIAQMVRRAADLPADATADAARGALLGLLDGFGDAAVAVDRLLALLGLTGEPGSRTEVFWAVRSFFEHLADTQPLVFTVDDLHWAEPMLLDLLDEVRDELRDSPILLLVQARPELLEQRTGWGSGSANSTTFSLDPLSPAQSAQLLAGLFGSPPPDHVVAAIDGWAGGNPLYVAEVGTHLVETGALAVDGAGWSVRSDLSTIAIPPGVAALLTARLDRLPEAERALLDRLSIIGLELSLGDARAVAAPETDVEALLSALHRRDILRRRRGAGTTTWAFRHVLVREAAYDSMPKVLRAEIHERFAERLSDVTTDAGAETAAFQAHHLEQAVRLQREISSPGAVVQALTDRAVAALTTAAYAAGDSENLAAAGELIERACSLLPTTDPRARRLVFHLIGLCLDDSEVTRARALAQRLSDLVASAGVVDELELLSVELVRRWSALEAGEPIDPAILTDLARRAIVGARIAGDSELLFAGLRAGAMAAATRGHWGDVAELSRELVETTDARGARVARFYTGAALLWGPMPARAGLHILEQTPRDPAATALTVIIAELTRAALLGYDGQEEIALEVVAHVEPLLADVGAFGVGVAAFLLSRLYVTIGDLDRAVAALVAGTEAMETKGSLSYASTLLAFHAIIALRRGQTDVAAALLERAEDATSEFDALSVSMCAACRAVIAARGGRPDDAQALAERALEAIDSSDQLVERADVRRLLVDVAHARADVRAERELLTAARDLYAAKGALPQLAETEQQLHDLDG